MALLSNKTTVIRSSTDSHASQYRKSIIDVGGSISGSTLSAINAFVKKLKSIGVWDLCSEICTYSGNNLASALVKLKYPNNIQSTLTNVNFTNADYSENTGLRGNGINKYLRTGWIANTQLVTSLNAHLSVYSRNNLSTLLTFPTYTGANSGARFLVQRTPLSILIPNRIDAYIGSGTQNNTYMASDIGFICASNLAQNSGHIFRNGALHNTNSNFTTNAKPSIENYIFATNNNGIPVNISDANICFHSFGQGLSADQVSKFYDAVQSLQVSLGRNV